MNRALVLTLVLFSLFIGALQEQLKMNINSNLGYVAQIEGYDDLSRAQRQQAIEQRVSQTPYDYFKSHEKFSFLYKLSSSELYASKWVLTILLIVVHFGLGLLIIKFLLGHTGAHFKAYMVIYGVGFLLAVVAYGIGILFKLDFYPFSRRIVGFLQSIIPVVFVFFISKMNSNGIKL